MAIADKQLWVFGKPRITEDATPIWVFGKPFVVRDGTTVDFLAKHFSANALLKLFGATKTFEADAIVVNRLTKTFTASALIRNRYSKTFDADAIILKTGTKTFTADAILTQKVVIISPKDAAEETSPVYMVASSTSYDLGGGKKHFEINIDDTSDAFGSLEVDTDSYTSQTNWEYWDGDSWEPMPAAGLDSAFFGNNVRYQATLGGGNKWWRIRELNLTD